MIYRTYPLTQNNNNSRDTGTRVANHPRRRNTSTSVSNYDQMMYGDGVWDFSSTEWCEFLRVKMWNPVFEMIPEVVEKEKVLGMVYWVRKLFENEVEMCKEVGETFVGLVKGLGVLTADAVVGHVKKGVNWGAEFDFGDVLKSPVSEMLLQRVAGKEVHTVISFVVDIFKRLFNQKERRFFEEYVDRVVPQNTSAQVPVIMISEESEFYKISENVEYNFPAFPAEDAIEVPVVVDQLVVTDAEPDINYHIIYAKIRNFSRKVCLLRDTTQATHEMIEDLNMSAVQLKNMIAEIPQRSQLPWIKLLSVACQFVTDLNQGAHSPEELLMFVEQDIPEILEYTEQGKEFARELF